MRSYALKRVLLAIPTIIGVITLVFFALHLAPGDPVNMMLPPDLDGPVREEVVARIRAQYGLDQPLLVQYVNYLSRLARLDLGRSFRTNTSIADDLARRIPNTLQLGLLSLAVAITLGVGFGVVSAVRRDTPLDNATMFGALFGVSIPSFWFGFMLMLLFGLWWRVLPPSGFAGPITSWTGFRHAILPALTLGLAAAGALARFTRSSMLDVLTQDYVRTARSKGLAERVVIVRHALKNALIPVVTIMGIQLGAVLSGSVITETVFAWPGIGRYMVTGINTRDFPVIQATVLVVAVSFVLANLVTDLVYAFIDPRIRYD
ncbi:MAG TPA: ABC transporter permease [Bacillota bacterium]|nr:ABC transporter permease [Bacillota bacterium]